MSLSWITNVTSPATQYQSILVLIQPGLDPASLLRWERTAAGGQDRPAEMPLGAGEDLPPPALKIIEQTTPLKKKKVLRLTVAYMRLTYALAR